MKSLLLIVLFCCLCLPLFAQEPPRPSPDIEILAEQLFPLQEEDLPYEELYENLLFYFTQPMDLNRAGREELQSLYLLSHNQIESLIRHQERNGPLLSLYELQAIPGWDLATIHKVLPFVKVQDSGLQGDNRSLADQLLNSGTRFALLRWERQPEQPRGFLPHADSLPPAYLGSPDKLYFRLRMNKARSFSFGLTAEKDAGEQLLFRPRERRYGADFYSFHAMLWNAGPFKRIVVGDYQVQYGQGLVLGAGFYLGKGAETITTVGRPSTGIRPYTSVVESGFFRGAAATMGNQQAAFTLFASHSPRDASLQQASDSLESIASTSFTSLQTTGLHRTPTEIANRRAIKETNLGAAGRWKVSPAKLSIGFTSLYSGFNQQQQPLSRLYNKFAFRGRQNWTASLFAEGHWQQLTYFSEWALSKGGGWGSVSSIIMPLSHGLDLSLLYRHYTKNFYSSYGAAFSEGTRLQNESGLYWGLKYRYNQALWFTAYFDYFNFPWLRYRVSAPSDGYEYMLRANWQPNKQLLLYAQYRGEHKDRDVNGDEKTKLVAEARKHNYILNLDFKPDKAWQLRTRVQGSRFQHLGEPTRGYAVMQDISYTLGSWRMSGRYALFQTDDWDNRQYAFERDVLWAFSIPAYYGRGIRYYALLQWKARHNISLWLRWARTHFRDRDEIGSGLEKITGNTRSNLKLQVKLDF